MISYVTTLSKYFIVCFMALYTLECFIVFRYKDEKSRKGIYARQVLLIVLVHFTCFLSICLKSGSMETLIFYAVFQVFLLIVLEVYPMIYPKCNRLLINNACMLVSIGLIMLVRLNFSAAVKQLAIFAFTSVLAGFIPFLMKKLKGLPNVPYIYAVIGVVSLAAVYFTGLLVNGSKLSVSVFGISFMPSEFIKILFVFYVAGALYSDSSFKNLVITTIIAAVHVLILAASNDLGAALLFFLIYVLMVFVATKNYIYLAIGLLTGSGIAVAAYKIFRHVRVRVSAFIDPFSVIDNEGYQITQSLFAISSGSWFGRGLYNGTPDSIPYVETDFIFSAICQEMGIIFSICLVLICLSLFLMFINISLTFKDKFYKLTALGLGSVFILQVFLTIGGGTRFIPLTGVTLPLVSHGGSSVMATLISIAVIQGMYVTVGEKEAGSTLKNDKKTNNILLGYTYFIIALFFALCVYLSVYAATHKEELLNNNYNPIQEITINQTLRGPVYSRDYVVLAETKVDKENNEKRFYPFYNIFSHVIGYSTNGRAGLEESENYYLINSNQPVMEKMSADIAGQKYKGDGVVTTLDVGLQKTAYTAIGSYSGAVVVSNPKTGEILALVSKPDFDPNEIDEIWDELINDNTSSVLLNRTTQGLYPPGSTFKTVTLLEYIRENPGTYKNYVFNCEGELNLAEGTIECYDHIVHGRVSLEDSFAKSCNSSFGNIGLLLNRDSFQSTLNELMFNEKLPIPLNYSESVSYAKKEYDDITMVRTAFGQGETLMTPIHMNMITAAVANKGVVMKPYLVSSVVNSNMNTIKSFDTEEYRTVMSEEEADIIAEMMRSVVTYGTAKRMNNKEYTIAGKTGSAEFSDSTQSTHSWFTGYAPYDDPEICVTIILEDAGAGNLYATPMALKIFDEYFRRFDDSLEEEQ